MSLRSGVTLSLAGLLCIGLVLPVSSADHGVCGGIITWVEFGSEGLYVDDREDGSWVYRENGQASGFQRGGNIAGVIVDPCGGDPELADDLIAHVPEAP